MVRIRPKDAALISRLMGLRKSYFTVADFERILGLGRDSLYVTLNRLVKSGMLVRLRKNVYTVFTEPVDAERIANEWYFPCYLSFESALSRYGILSQIPYTLTFATSRSSKKMDVGDFEVEFRHLKGDLFFGYVLENGKNIATPEKALLDELYFMSRGKVGLNIKELDLRDINKKTLEEYAKRFPPYIRKPLAEAKKYLGTTPVTNEGQERIAWKRALK